MRLTTTAYRKAVRRAFALYRRKAEWNRVRQTGMKLAFDWATAAGHYTAPLPKVDSRMTNTSSPTAECPCDF